MVPYVSVSKVDRYASSKSIGGMFCAGALFVDNCFFIKDLVKEGNECNFAATSFIVKKLTALLLFISDPSDHKLLIFSVCINMLLGLLAIFLGFVLVLVHEICKDGCPIVMRRLNDALTIINIIMASLQLILRFCKT